jgi:hypothetical protein
LASSQSGTPVLDSGFFINRGIGSTQGFIWDESADEFSFIQTNDGNSVLGNVNISSYSNIRAAGATLSQLKLTNGAQNGYILTSDGGGLASWLSPTVSSANFANTDLSFTGNRIHNTNNNYLEIRTGTTTYDKGWLVVGHESQSPIYSFVGLGYALTYVYSDKFDSTHIASTDYNRLTVASSSITINNDGFDYDFRIEGDTDQNLLFTDGSTDRVGIGKNSPGYKLDVEGEIFSSGGLITNRFVTNGQDSAGVKSVIYTGNSNYIYGVDSEIQSSSTFSVGLRSIVLNAKYNVGLMASIGNAHSSIGAEDYGAILFIGSSATTSNSRGLYINNLSEGTGTKYGMFARVGGLTSSQSTGNLVQVFTTTSGTKTGVQISVQQKSTTAYGINSSISDGNTNYGVYQLISGTGTNYGLYNVVQSGNINYGSYNQITSSGTSNIGLYLNVSGATQNFSIITENGESVFNDSGSSTADFRIEGDTQTHLFFLDASVDNIGVNNSSPNYKLDVVGTVSTTGFRMTNGAGSNYIMVSDTSGNARWATPSSINIATKYSTTIGLTASVSQTITHNLQTQFIQISVWDNVVGDLVGFLANNRTNNTVDVSVTVTGTYSIIIIG